MKYFIAILACDTKGCTNRHAINISSLDILDHIKQEFLMKGWRITSDPESCNHAIHTCPYCAEKMLPGELRTGP